MLESDENQDEDSDGDGDENDDACLGKAILELVLRGHTVGSNYRPSAFKLDQIRMKTVKTEDSDENEDYCENDIYIMVKCLSVCVFVTKNDHFLKRPVCQP